MSHRFLKLQFEVLYLFSLPRDEEICFYIVKSPCLSLTRMPTDYLSFGSSSGT